MAETKKTASSKETEYENETPAQKVQREAFEAAAKAAEQPSKG